MAITTATEWANPVSMLPFGAVRLLTGDNVKQGAAVRSLFASEPIWITKTVSLETAWVLRSLYGFGESEITDALTVLLGLKNVQVEDEPSVAAALALAARGIDLADAIHPSSRPPDALFVSFDKSSVQRAKRAGVTAISAMSSLRRGKLNHRGTEVLWVEGMG